jgi:potassium-transporting ATPase KdpC subunit
MLENQWRPAIVGTLLLCLITGFIYPGIVTGLAQLLFPRQANGSLVTVGGRVVGSALIGQAFTRDQYFHPRPSSAGAGYEANNSLASNKGPTDRTLADSLVAPLVREVRAREGVTGPVPGDLVTRSASGLDPDISPAAAAIQVPRVARARGVPEAAVRELLGRHTQGRQLGFLGEPRVNVLLLNVALDSAWPVGR